MRKPLHLLMVFSLLWGGLAACDGAAPPTPRVNNATGPDAGQEEDSGQDQLRDPDAAQAQCDQDSDCDDGVYCNGVERCFEGQCFAPPEAPCQDDIGCTVDSCDEEHDTCVFTPDHEVCGPGRACDPKAGCFGDPECQRDADCNDGLFCNGAETCHPRDGLCQPGAAPDCGDGQACTVDSCDEASDRCQHAPDHGLCDQGQLCDQDQGCATAPDCQQDSDCDDGLFCNGAEACHEGVCQAGAPPEVEDGVGCTEDRCDEASDTVLHLPLDARCDNGRFCDGAEICHPLAGCQPGAPPLIDDGLRCTLDRCDEEADTLLHLPNHAACDDGLFCNGAETCDVTLGCTAGAAPVLDDGLLCTLDRCDEAQDRVLHEPQHGRCDDGLFCNGAETCDVTLGCQPGAAPDTEDGVSCTADSCDEAQDRVVHRPMHAACDDGLFCNGAETCDVTLGCQPGAPPEVEDGVSCTVDGCDEALDRITHTPSDALCQDGRACNGAETCDAALDCQPGPAPVVDDGVACTLDTCDDDTGQPLHIPQDSRCDDGLFCNGVETCDGLGGCQPGAPPEVDDGVACTRDVCDEDSDTVLHIPQDVRCDDNLFCNGAETCDVARGCLPGAPPAVDDGVACTVDRCNEAQDRVTHTPEDARCDDDLFCNGAETCDLVRGCQPGAPPAVDDGVACTLDRCDEAQDRVLHTPQDGLCDDNLFCNGAETCHVTLGCLPGAPPAADDGVACTLDRCDEARDRITHTPEDARCDDDLFCNGAETCDVARGCLPGAPPSVDDGVSCTLDRCDEAQDRATHTPQDGACDDGLFCNGAEACHVTLGCQAGSPPVFSDGVSCTVDACDEALDQASYQPQDDLCQDNDRCTEDRCDAEAGCVFTPIVTCQADGCCPQGCDANSDPDCAAVCGNGALESGEGCEQDQDCAQGARCAGCACVESCQDLQDNDGDGQVDCEDSDCVGQPGCSLLLPFEALTSNDQGIAAWNINGTGPEPRRQGHPLPSPLDRCGGSVTYYFLSSPDYAGPLPENPPLDPDATGGALAVEPTRGAWALEAALAQHNIPLSQLGFSFGLMSLGDDIQGEDWWIEDTTEYRIYAGGLLRFTLGGAPLLEGPMPPIELEIQYNDPGDCADESISASSQPLDLDAFVDVSQGQPASVRAVAQALLQDLRDTGGVRLIAATLQPAQQLEFSVNGRRGAYYDAPIMQLEALAP